MNVVSHSHRSDDSNSEIAVSQQHAPEPSISNPHVVVGATSHQTSAYGETRISAVS